jgi:curved DNA-binding protein CbpA
VAKSYYAILGISSGANTEEIRAAYRRLVKEFHPDHYSGGTDIFQQVQEAYSVLSDSEGRRQYDETLDRVRARAF